MILSIQVLYNAGNIQASRDALQKWPYYLPNGLFAMAEITKLARAPITEAIIDLRVEPEREFPLEKLTVLQEALAESYPQHERRDLFESKFQVVPELRQVSQSTRERGLQGFFFKSTDSRDVAQFRVDGFTFNRLKPYTSWEEIFEEAKRLWDLYVATLHPEFVTRIAVRYINHIHIPLPVNELDEYLSSPPQIPGDLPKSVSSFLTRVVLVDEQTGVKANITQALESSGDAQHVPVIFDIDVYRKKKFKPNDPEIWQMFDDLRLMKNRIFFSHITEKTVELLK